MVLLRSACLVLGLLISSLTLRETVVHAQQATDMAMVTNGNENGIVNVDAVFVSKELFRGVPATAATTGKKRLGGRKLVEGNVLMEEEAVNGKTPKISGKDTNASKKPFGTSQKYMNDQKSGNLLKRKALNSEHSGRKQNLGSEVADLPDTVASQLRSQDSEAVPFCGSLECFSTSRKLVLAEFHDHFRKTESKKLLEAAKHIVSLIHKDYSGMNGPRSSPPINNHEPSRRSFKP
ncbi:hypothetical protein NE237_005842 [Protea cynaroides]|uniref:Uncharacterized protein n=1 Tax=Protea cynaroides TaxID=273540 RepID=A0A9Q0KL64_9MAGN|nr:hypothetical protein NE237_005842 [Protea cynaroides]